MKNFLKTFALLLLVVLFIVAVVFLTSLIHGLLLTKYQDSVEDFIVTYGGLFISVYVVAMVLKLIGSLFTGRTWWKKIISAKN